MAKIKNPRTNPRTDLNWLLSKKYNADTYRNLPRDTRITIARKKLAWFNPPHDPAAEGQYNDAWWQTTLNGCYRWSDERTVAVYASLFPDRTRKDWTEPTYPPVDFYATVTADNALGWFNALPDHLKAQVRVEVGKKPNGATAPKNSLYERVFETWGDRPELPNEPESEIDGLDTDGSLRVEVWREWVRMYDDLQLVEVILEIAPGMQAERRLLSSALGVPEVGALPNQAVGLDDTQAATIQWLQSQGQTPLEFLAATYKDPEAKMADRITAARTLMDYVHRKVPVKTEIEQKTEIDVASVNREQLRKLTVEELATLEVLLEKTKG